MAAVLHGCGSPRQHTESNISLSETGGCMLNSNHQHQLHQTATPMYSNTPKYSRSANQQKYPMYASNSQCVPASTLPPQSYMQPYATTQRASLISTSDACRNNYWNHPHAAATMMYRSGRHHSKRKSAVELLAETKTLYIKSDAVMERLNQSNYRTTAITSGNKRGRNSVDNRDPTHHIDAERRFAPSTHMNQASNRSGHMHHHHHHNHNMHVGRHSHGATIGNNIFQNKLRAMFSTETPRDCSVVPTARPSERYRNELPRQYDFGVQANSSGALNKETSTLGYANEQNAAMKIPPLSLYVAPQSYDNAFSYDAENSSGDELILTENYRPISPPAEYAAERSQTNNEQRSRYNYQRSYSHSHEIAAENAKHAATSYNINSHKSLPDLHSHISRHSPHSEILSCCSRGNRSIKSAGESSLNRDSGGSSGHYTHRSEPCYRQRENERERDRDRERDREMYEAKNCCNLAPMELRRDSGSSTQHSANSYCGYPSFSYGRNANTACNECHCKSNVRFESSDYLFNFTTPEVPEAFQDDYTPPSPSMNKYKSTEEPRYASCVAQQMYNVPPFASGMQISKNAMVQSPGSAPSVEEISPPPIQFKRQRCIRFKNRSRISLPSVAMHTNTVNTVSDNADTSYPAVEQHFRDMNQPRELEGLSQLEKFFDRLGLNDDKFHEIYSPARRRRSAESDSDESSTVFFSDVSTVDSMRLPDSTETQTTQTYRPSEPPSIVERNARIIKWLCNCRKLQYA